MNKIRLFYFPLLLALFAITQQLSAKLVVFDQVDSLVEIGGKIEVLEDPKGEFSADSLFEAKGFTPSAITVPNLGFTDSYFWLRVTIENRTEREHLLLELGYPITDIVDFYYLEDGKIRSRHYGQYKNFSERKYDHQNYIFDLSIPQGSQETILLRVKSGEQILVPLTLGTEQRIFERHLVRDLISGIYFGIILVMAFYNLFVFISTRDLSYLYYILYIVFVGLVQANFQGYTFKYLWPNNNWMAINDVYIISALSGIFGMIFTKEFVKTDQFAVRLNKGFYLLIGLYVVALTFTTAKEYTIGFILLNATAMMVSLYMIYAGYIVSRKGYRPARFFLWAQTIFLVGVVIFVLRNFGLLPYNNFTYYILQIGSGIEVIVLSIALADRINILTQEKEASQAEALAVSKENERIIKEQNIVLENTVEERTTELRKTNEDLNEAMKNLKETQSQLVSAEKMASLGQLTAGIAHEINNPINFVTSSVKPLRQNISEVILILRKYEELNGNTSIQEKLAEIDALKDELEMNFLLEEINDIIESIDEGAQRTAEIVQGLRNFSHVDDIGIKDNDINKGISSTLKLLKSELENIKVKKSFAELPLIECYGGKINQVFLNIINNAVQALKKYGSRTEDPQITITTELLNDKVMVLIEDNGPGIPEDIKDKIFDPFFTTKDVGEGTGLGLSVAYGIIEQHHGSIKVETEIGKGTKFIVALPLTQFVK